MKTETDFSPLIKHLTEEILPWELAKVFDELAYDYARMFIRLQTLEDELSQHIHEDTGEFIFQLKILRDILKKCKAKK